MSAQEHPTLVVCPSCGSESQRSSATCWLCHAGLAGAQPLLIAEIVDTSRTGWLSQRLLLWLTMACVVFAVILGIGIYMSDPGALIGYLIFVTPAIVATAGRAVMSRMRGETAKGGELFLTFVITLAAVWGVVLLLTVALIAGLLVLCLANGM